jgi:hypothetical protein
MKQAIGGYFELEICDNGSIYHDDALALNSGRNSFEYILRCNRYKRIHLPYFTCDVILQPIKKLNLEFLFYHIDESFQPVIFNFKPGDVIVYTNYFGLNQNNVESLTKDYSNIIIDNSQSFFDKPIEQVSTFYSPRKFFGVPDGGFVYESNKLVDTKFQIDNSIDRVMHLLLRIEKGAEKGYNLFKENDSKLDNQEIKLMSNLTKKLLCGINFESVINKRVNNFNFLHQCLKKTNKLSAFIDQVKITCPMVYPYWIENGSEYRKKLLLNSIYTPQYWPNVLDWTDKGSIEYEFTNNMIYLPVDQRYTNESLNSIFRLIQ